MTFQPNRPVRIGTTMAVTDGEGRVPDAGKASAAERPAPELPALYPMTKAQLIGTAKAEGVAFETDDNKAGLIAKIEVARAATQVANPVDQAG